MPVQQLLHNDFLAQHFVGIYDELVKRASPIVPITVCQCYRCQMESNRGYIFYGATDIHVAGPTQYSTCKVNMG